MDIHYFLQLLSYYITPSTPKQLLKNGKTEQLKSPRNDTIAEGRRIYNASSRSLRSSGKAPVEQALPEPLSERELEILRLIAHGLSNQDITGQLYIAMSTLKTHINHIYGKLSVRTRTQAIFQARVLKLVE